MSVRDNPLLQPSTLPFGVPPFDRLASADFPAAFDMGMKDELDEVRRITASPERIGRGGWSEGMGGGSGRDSGAAARPLCVGAAAHERARATAHVGEY